MEIIIHGKPVSGSCKATTGLDSSLIEEICRIFFQSERGGVPKRMALAVDTLYWKSKWHTIYSYTRYDLTDFSRDGEVGRRDSYFALSLVIPQNYLYLTSEVYKLLDNVFKNNIEGVYVSASGKYLVPDFTNVDAFNAIVNKINSGFANMQDLIDGSFKQNYSGQKIRYNLLDCDSKAFLQDLRQHGRIIVGEGDDFPVKCSGAVLQEKDRKIVQLNASVAGLNKRLQDAQNNASSNSKRGNDRISALEAEISKLKAERDNLLQNAGSAEKDYRQLVAGLKALLPGTDAQLGAVKEQATPLPLYKKFLPFVPIANCALLLLCFLLLLVSESWENNSNSPIVEQQTVRIDSLTKTIEVQKDTIKNLRNEVCRINANVASLNNTIIKKDGVIAAQDAEIKRLNKKSNNQGDKSPDADCQIKIVNSKQETIASGAEINNNDTLTITLKPKQGYSWHTENLDENARKQLEESSSKDTIIIPIKVKEASKKVVILYRTSEWKNRNPENEFTFKIKQQ